MMTFQSLFGLGDDFHTYTEGGTAEEIKAVYEARNKLAQRDFLPESTLKRAAAVEQKYYLLVAGEMWCPDCHLNITAFQKLCELQPNIKMSVVTKGRAERDMQALPGLNNIRIPAVAVLNDQFELIGTFIERPKAVANAEDFQLIKPDYRAGRYLNDSISDILDILEV